MFKYSFTDLVLLVGTNPLPNYVVTKYFLQSNVDIQCIWLVYSEHTNYQQGTEELANCIKDTVIEDINKARDIKMNLVSLSDVSSAIKIKNDIEKKMLSKLLSNGSGHSVHLNYTGGTKAMAVHIYREVEKKIESKSSFSYLDARDFTLKDDNEGTITNDLRETLDISLETLMNLHGYERKDKNSKQDTFDNQKVINEFKKIINNEELDSYLKWQNNFLRKNYFDEKGFIENKSRFLKHNKLEEEDKSGWDRLRQEFNDVTPPSVMNLLKSLPSDKSIIDENNELWIPDKSINKKLFKNRLKPSVNGCLAGKWLESYVENIIKENIEVDEQLKLKDIPIESNWEIKSKKGNKEFELDVIVINGYQICGISCTTGKDKGLCKEKGFEILFRVNQIGGDEARAILVTPLSDDRVEDLTEDLKMVSGTTEDKLLVIGQADLKEEILWKKIKEHIWSRR
ncbi:MAG: hypothetical protein K9L17_01060 [Clostridiales bacterium]|nr:hypothetical protein [Clostridiales bacterium]MCF8021282.1 hypothetical protein [Clostridiales bacterium]